MENRITTFAAVKTFYESGNDLIKVFCNLTLLTINKDKACSVSYIQDRFIDEVNLHIPKDILRTVLKRLHSNRLIFYRDIKNDQIDSIELSEEGKKEELKIRENFNTARREKNALLESIKNYLAAKGYNYTILDVSGELNIFIEINSYSAIFSLEKETSSNGLFTNTNEIQQLIADFFIQSEKLDDENFKRLKSILYGKIISAAFLSQRISEGAKVKNLEIYLDTNIVFSLMGFHEDYYNEPAKEVVDLIKKVGGTIKVFAFTKDEIVSKLRGYLYEYDYYSSQIKVDSIYHVLKRKGFSRMDIVSIIDSIETKLSEMSISVDYLLDKSDLTKDKEIDISKLGVLKPLAHINSLKHDIAAVLGIKSLREKKPVYFWEKAKFIFLSADTQLVTYDFKEHGHKENGTFPEVVSRSDIASLLWLKGSLGSDNVFVHNFFSNYMREKVINTNLWHKFIDEIKKRKDAGLITQDDIDIIISFGETENILKQKGEQGIGEILNDYKISERKEASILKDKENAKNKEILVQQSKKLEDIGNAITKECKKVWSQIINLSVITISVALVLFIIYLLTEFGSTLVANMIQISSISIIIIICTSIVQRKEFKFLGFLIEVRNNFENKQVARCIKKKKEKYQIDLNSN